MAQPHTTQSKPSRFPWMWLLAILLIAALGRGLILASGTVSFHSDEAVVGLMARHILQGDIPTFFYGQDYMGSLNAFSAATAFAVMGESVASIRAAQLIIYLVLTASSFWVGWHLSGRVLVAAVTGLAVAVPVPALVIYTATNIGGYAETLLIGNLLLILGYDVTTSARLSWSRWMALGVLAGIGWWVNGLVIVYAMPVAVLAFVALVRSAEQRGGYALRLLVGLGAFFVGGLPWWLYNLRHDWAALGVYLPGGGFESTLVERVIGLAVLGLPTIVGMRYTWLAYFVIPVGLVVLVVYVVAVYRLARTPDPALHPGARAFVLGVPLTMTLVFISSSFGVDPTGRYLLPLIVPLGIALGTFVVALRERSRWAWILPLVLIVGYNAAGTTAAVLAGEPGFTTQFNLDTHASNAHDAELIDFLQANDLLHGYANYWITYRLAFLSGESLQYASPMSYRPDEFTGDITERYPAYAEATANADRIAYITWDLLPGQAVALETTFDRAGLRYSVEQIGPFIVYFDFDQTPPSPDQLEELL